MRDQGSSHPRWSLVAVPVLTGIAARPLALSSPLRLVAALAGGRRLGQCGHDPARFPVCRGYSVTSGLDW